MEKINPSSFPELYGPSEGYLFVVTYGRSGSTLLQNLLNGIDGYCIRGENNATLQHLALSWNAMANKSPMANVRRAGRTTEQSDPWYGTELTNADRFGASIGNAFVREVLILPEGTRVGGFKEIRYLMPRSEFMTYMNYLLRFFPNPRFLFNTRDHEAVARSGWWAECNTENVLNQLSTAEATWDVFIEAHPELCLKLHYDDYTADPSCFDALFDFLGEPRDPELVERVLGTRLTHLKE
ncbi:sulfotransferase [Tropicimonas aquimaris]|uniref:Sulfotransferase n=1 Tax=Tropicimonas aquimaris TaxID=914152 RepID=A0ABW3IT68_9RHOB